MESKRTPKYMPVSSTLNSLNQLEPRKQIKSVNRKPKSTAKYLWETSIPKRWKEIKGEDYFQPVYSNSRPKHTLEFLKESQRYIDKIRDSTKSVFLEEDYTQEIKHIREKTHKVKAKIRKIMSDIRLIEVKDEHFPMMTKGLNSQSNKKLSNRRKSLQNGNKGPEIRNFQYKSHSPSPNEFINMYDSSNLIAPSMLQQYLNRRLSPHRLIPSGIATQRFIPNQQQIFLEPNLLEYLNRFELTKQKAFSTPFVNRNLQGKKLMKINL